MEADVSDKSGSLEDVTNSCDRRTCDHCNIHDIHINDWQNHEKSRRHRSKLRAKDKVPLKKQNSYYITCSQCTRDFTDEKFYIIHLGTKTHKRNLKRLGIKDGVQPDSIPHPVEAATFVKKGRRLGILTEEITTNVIRKKYKVRNIKTDDLNFRSYIYSLASYLSVRLALNKHVQDFIISVNNKDYGAFGDIVLNIAYKEKNIIYAIQCKKVNQIIRQINSLEEAKLHLEKQYDNLAKLKHTWDPDTKFAIFTTCNTGSNFCKTVNVSADILNKWKTKADISNDAIIELKPLTKKNDIVNVTSDPENVYSFLLKDKIECKLPYIFFYTSQRVVPSMVNQLLKLKFDNYPDISKDYIRYIENWGEGKLGGYYHLRKKDIILKLGEVLLTPYIISPKKIQSQHDNFDIWNGVLDKVDLTIVKNEPFIISKLCQPLNKLIERTLDTNIDTITRTISLKNDAGSISDNVKDPIKPYWFEVVQDQLRDDVPLSLVYNIFWKAGKIPLLLSSENQEESKGFMLNVITFMKQMGVEKKFLLKSAELNINHFKEQLNIFSCLDDIKDFVDLDKIKIRVSDSFSLSLKTINSSDLFFFKDVTPNMFFDLSLGRYSLKPAYGEKLKKSDELKIILSDEVKQELENNLYGRTDLLRMNSSSYIDNRLKGIDPSLF